MVSIPDWPRANYRPGGGNALLAYRIFGRPPAEFKLEGETYRTAGIPEGIGLYVQTKKEAPESFSVASEGPMGDNLARQPKLARTVRAQEHCLSILGQVNDPANLNYLRDMVGLMTWVLDQGSVAILDVQLGQWWSPQDWRKVFFDPAKAQPLHHVAVIVSPENDGTEWFHTRGMRKFGRPDLSLRFVPAQYRKPVGTLFNRLILSQAAGSLIAEGYEIKMPELPAGMKAYHWGSYDDLAFNNVHVEIAWPNQKPRGAPVD